MPLDWLSPAWRFRAPQEAGGGPGGSRRRSPRRGIARPAGEPQPLVPADPWPAARTAPAADLPRPEISSLVAVVIGWGALAAGLAAFPLLATTMVLDRLGLAGDSGIGFGGWGGGAIDGWFDYALAACLLASHLGGITAQILDRGRRQWGVRAIAAWWLSVLLGFPLDWLLGMWLPAA